jgi:hypothetical protein
MKAILPAIDRIAWWLDLFSRLPFMDWDRWRLCCDPAKPNRSTTALPAHRDSDFGRVQSPNGFGIGDAASPQRCAMNILTINLVFSTFVFWVAAKTPRSAKTAVGVRT